MFWEERVCCCFLLFCVYSKRAQQNLGTTTIPLNLVLLWRVMWCAGAETTGTAEDSQAPLGASS
eukprot:2546067-Amphidinium_carterae.1